ncbi:hypothetical protein BV25DRAFT_363024 [Artomyces pyxidatus]|uniref:Uncharacterized protein n=1 Tax=Artomyces pyxidatus TaxID=48021 RepID=A0ACB8T4W6_9AGAM|nr:hypothetical protein BV25DRAFT_363024 [Artomyces pyxidatus]
MSVRSGRPRSMTPTSPSGVHGLITGCRKGSSSNPIYPCGLHPPRSRTSPDVAFSPLPPASLTIDLAGLRRGLLFSYLESTTGCSDVSCNALRGARVRVIGSKLRPCRSSGHLSHGEGRGVLLPRTILQGTPCTPCARSLPDSPLRTRCLFSGPIPP